jgi:hypothetical protein
MPKSTEIIKLSPEELLQMIEKVRARVKKSTVLKDMFEEYNVDLEEFDYIPMAFADLDVSARTDHGCIYFSYKLLEDGSFDSNDHYILHETNHFLQQCAKSKPTEGSNDDDYLDDPDEKEAFKAQTEFLEDTRGEDVAENYVDQLLDHHDVDGNERKERKDELLNRKAQLARF